jgi:AcrR family transcriptional regulator
MPPRDRTKRRALPTQERAVASVDAILTATEQLLAEQGFLRTTTNHIAARAGVNVALLYRYFAGKEAIAGALIERHAERTYEAVQQTLDANRDASIEVVIRAVLAALVESPHAPALHRELVELVDATRRRQVVQNVGERLLQQLTVFLAARAPELRPLADPAATLFVLQHTIEATTHAASFYRPTDLSMERVLDALSELVLRTLSR